jgi:hypothetical protein
MRLLLLLRQSKFMFAFRALGHAALYRGFATRARKCSTIRYIEGKPTFRALHYMFWLRAHSLLLSLNALLSKILKTFLRIFVQFDAIILTTLKTIKYHDSKHMKIVPRR